MTTCFLKGDEDMDSEDAQEKENGEEEEDDDSDDDEEDDDDDDSNDVDEAFRAEVQAALGAAGIPDNDNEVMSRNNVLLRHTINFEHGRCTAQLSLFLPVLFTSSVCSFGF
jgi:hypothetical protein